MTRAYFVSDIHLRSMQEPNAVRLLGFLRGEALKASHLYLVGDIFDLWVGAHAHFADRYRPIALAVRAATRAGVKVAIFEGNHDIYLRDFWEAETGANVYRDASVFQLAGLKIRVEHGDLMNPNDRGYLFLRKLLRSKAIEALAKALPSRLVAAIGNRASATSRAYSHSESDAEGDASRERSVRIRKLIHDHALASRSAEEFDLIVSGHVHVADDWSFLHDGRKVRSVNLGSWDSEPRAFLVTENSQEFVSL